MIASILICRLTQMEMRVAKAIMYGKANKWIADDFTLSQRTVEAHRANVFQKMRVRNAIELRRLLSQSVNHCAAARHVGPVWLSSSEIESTSG